MPASYSSGAGSFSRMARIVTTVKLPTQTVNLDLYTTIASASMASWTCVCNFRHIVFKLMHTHTSRIVAVDRFISKTATPGYLQSHVDDPGKGPNM